MTSRATRETSGYSRLTCPYPNLIEMLATLGETCLMYGLIRAHALRWTHLMQVRDAQRLVAETCQSGRILAARAVCWRPRDADYG